MKRNIWFGSKKPPIQLQTIKNALNKIQYTLSPLRQKFLFFNKKRQDNWSNHIFKISSKFYDLRLKRRPPT